MENQNGENGGSNYAKSRFKVSKMEVQREENGDSRCVKWGIQNGENGD